MLVKRALSLAALAAVSVFIAGCGSRDEEVFGTWKSKDGAMTMTFNPDYTFAGKGQQPTSGKWFIHTGRVKLTDVAVKGKLISETLKDQIEAIHRSNDSHKEYALDQTLNPTLTLSNDGKTLTADQEMNGQRQVFEKVAPTK